MNLQDDHTLDCPYCGETLAVLIDASVPQQIYVEDCHVCCQPMVVRVRVEDGIVTELNVRQESD